MQPSQKTLAPFLWVGGVALGLLVLVALRGHTFSTEPFVEPASSVSAASPSTEPSAVNHETYVVSVVEMIKVYQALGDAAQTQQALLAMRVPSEDRETHKDLVMLLGKAVAGETEQSQALYASLKSTVIWLP